MGRNIYLGPLLGAAAIPASIALDAFGGGMSPQEAVGKIASAYVGYNPVSKAYEWDTATANYTAIAVGIVASILCGKFGINKRLPRGWNI